MILFFVILGGSDCKFSDLFFEGCGKYVFFGCKVVDIYIDGCCLIEIVVECFKVVGVFYLIYIVGFVNVYFKM